MPLSSPRPKLIDGNFGCAVTLSVAPPTPLGGIFLRDEPASGRHRFIRTPRARIAYNHRKYNAM
ncbi:hypothetical protein HUS70_09470 [Pandoraea nosoerga]|uniref:hypothetical protein n=1 Tax=Pandoraea TaxID=93217 RepID=UPI0012401ACE|nr:MULTISPECIES: hypothetical protein [Pandoraea]MBN4665127.1 hypothetical protein [Pandoraea nosoerga]MBN4675157.1 hypothetical protein [Pandoraea nosoerga]MBN4680870.1 hypothetical protein [Pandoraea nosoerga]MBN4744872.1 hypothetical protein [Pandoraea nosoerga]